MFAKSQTDWPFGWSAKQAKRSNHDPAWKVKGNHGPSTTWLAANHSHPFPFPGPIARLGSFYAFTFHPIAAMVGFYLSTSPVFMLTGSAWKKKQPTLWTLGMSGKVSSWFVKSSTPVFLCDFSDGDAVMKSLGGCASGSRHAALPPPLSHSQHHQLRRSSRSGCNLESNGRFTFDALVVAFPPILRCHLLTHSTSWNYPCR